MVLAKLRRRSEIQRTGATMTAAAARLTVPVAQFLRWWLRELQACLPGSRTGAMAMRSRVLIARVLPDQAVFHCVKARARGEIGRIAIDGVDDAVARKQVKKIRRKAGIWRTNAVLCLPANDVLQCRVSLPLAAQENLLEVLGFEMERFTAFKSDEVYYSHRLIDENRAEKRITAKLVVAPRTVVDTVVRLAKRWGMTPDMITVEDGDSAIDWTVNLLPKSIGSSSRPGVGQLPATLALIAMVLAGIATYLEFHQQARLLAAYEANLAEGRAASLRAEELRAQVSQLLDRGRYAAQRKQLQPLLIDVLDETTRLLPDSTWVTQFRLQKEQLTLSGYAVAASTLIEVLEASPILSHVRFASPVTVDSKQGLERFNLSAQLVPNGDAS